jgi:hypothetical protein
MHHCEDPNNPNNPAAGISGGVCVNHLWPVVAGGGGMKDEVLKLALEALEIQAYNSGDEKYTQAITAIKQALAAQPAVQEPIGYAVPTFDFDNSVIKKVHYAGTVPLYTTPPAAQRQWVGLNQDEFRDFASTLDYGTGGLIRAIEAKLRSKNT